MNRILLPTDFSDSAEQAARHALFLAQQYGSTLHLLHVVSPPAPEPLLSQEIYQKLDTKAYEQLTRIYTASATNGIEIELAIERGEVAPAILDYAARHEIDLIVMGTHGRRGIKRLFMGSVTEEVVREAGIPVFAVRERDEPFPAKSLQRILVPLDLSEHSRRALTYAKKLAASYDARIDLLHVIVALAHPGIYGMIPNPTPEVTKDLKKRVKQEMRRRIEEAKGPEVEVAFHLVRGDASGSILDFAEEQGTDLIVMTSHGLTGLDRFMLGSVTEKVMRSARCPIYIVKSFARMVGLEE